MAGVGFVIQGDFREKVVKSLCEYRASRSAPDVINTACSRFIAELDNCGLDPRLANVLKDGLNQRDSKTATVERIVHAKERVAVGIVATGVIGGRQAIALLKKIESGLGSIQSLPNADSHSIDAIVTGVWVGFVTLLSEGLKLENQRSGTPRLWFRVERMAEERFRLIAASCGSTLVVPVPMKLYADPASAGVGVLRLLPMGVSMFS